MAKKNYFSIHINKKSRKTVNIGKFISPEQKRNLALKMLGMIPDSLQSDLSEMVVFTKNFRKDSLLSLVKKEINL